MPQEHHVFELVLPEAVSFVGASTLATSQVKGLVVPLGAIMIVIFYDKSFETVERWRLKYYNRVRAINLRTWFPES